MGNEPNFRTPKKTRVEVGLALGIECKPFGSKGRFFIGWNGILCRRGIDFQRVLLNTRVELNNKGSKE
jgi:hypothetical protein